MHNCVGLQPGFRILDDRMYSMLYYSTSLTYASGRYVIALCVVFLLKRSYTLMQKAFDIHYL